MKRLICVFLPIMVVMTASMLQAGTKEEIMRLQNDVLAMKEQIQELEKSLNERLDGLKSLIVQLNDQTAKSNMLLDGIRTQISSQNSGMRSSDQSLIKEIRSLSSRVDDASTRISAMAQQLNELRVQSKALDQVNSPQGVPSPESMYNQAFTDFIQGNFDLAVQGFTAYLNTYPGGDKAASALLNIGEAHANQNMLPQAVASYTRVINEYSQSASVPAALYKRAKAELALQKKDDAIADLKNILDKYPQSPEAVKAKSELQLLSPAKPAAPGRRKT